MKPTTDSITKARRHNSEVISSAAWLETHLYASLISFQDMQPIRTRNELAAAREHVLNIRRKTTAILRNIAHAQKSQ